MADFKKAILKILQNEGGYTADPDDGGNWTLGEKGKGLLIGTNFGISAPMLMAHLGRVPSVSEMRNLSVDTAEDIYEICYWKPIRGNEIQNQDEADRILDSAVNNGTGTAIILAKRALGMDENTHMDDNLLSQLNNTA